jgi:hypothetical protein
MNLRSSTGVIVLILMILLVGCGKKTSLIPPQKLVPVRITDLRYSLDEKGVTLKWSYPEKMENGDTLQAIESFEVYRAGIPVEDFCQECPVQFDDPVEIDGGRLSGSGELKTAVYTDANLLKGYRYFYKIRSRAGWWYPSGDSNTVSFLWAVVPGMVQNLRLESGDKKIILRWDPVQNNTAGEPLEQEVMYQIYRKKTGEDFSPQGETIQKTEFSDEDVVNGQFYTYKVQALIKTDDSWQKGLESGSVSGAVRALSSLASPQHPVAVKIPEGVKLLWQGISSGDLAGYRIYRRAGDSDQAEFLAEVGPGQDYYIDGSDTGGRFWFYSVTSFDTAKPVNESVPSEEALIDLR